MQQDTNLYSGPKPLPLSNHWSENTYCEICGYIILTINMEAPLTSFTIKQFCFVVNRVDAPCIARIAHDLASATAVEEYLVMEFKRHLVMAAYPFSSFSRFDPTHEFYKSIHLSPEFIDVVHRYSALCFKAMEEFKTFKKSFEEHRELLDDAFLALGKALVDSATDEVFKTFETKMHLPSADGSLTRLKSSFHTVFLDDVEQHCEDFVQDHLISEAELVGIKVPMFPIEKLLNACDTCGVLDYDRLFKDGAGLKRKRDEDSVDEAASKHRN